MLFFLNKKGSTGENLAWCRSSNGICLLHDTLPDGGEGIKIY